MRKRSHRDSSSVMADDSSRTSLFGSFKRIRSWHRRDASPAPGLAKPAPAAPPAPALPLATRVRYALAHKLPAGALLNPPAAARPRDASSLRSSLARSSLVPKGPSGSATPPDGPDAKYSLSRHGFAVVGSKTVGLRAPAKPRSADMLRLKWTLLDNYKRQLAAKERLLSAQLDEEEARAPPGAGAPPPLRPDQIEAVQRQFGRAPHTPHATVVDAFKIELTYADLATLRPRAWLNDNVIDMFLGAVTARAGDRAFAFTTHFFTRLDEDGYGAVRRWALRKKLDVFRPDFVFVPVNRGNMHWTLAVVNNRARRLEFYDSLPSGRGERELEVLHGYLAQEARRLGTPMPAYDRVPFAEGPTQSNGFDCGVFVCENVRRLAEGLPLDYAQNSMPDVRLQMAHTLLELNPAAKL